jgi:hypothetical protein
MAAERMSADNVVPGMVARDVPVATAPELDAAIGAATPVVIKGLVDHWPALAAGKASPLALTQYLSSMDVGIPCTVMEAPASSRGRFGYSADLNEFTFSKSQRGIAEAFGRIVQQGERPGAPIVAVQQLPLGAHMPDFARQNPLRVLPHYEPRLWIGGRVKTQIHNDRDHNLACVIAGRRRFLLFPPEQVANLYIGPIERPPPLSVVNVDAPDLARFPRFEAALRSAWQAELGPGDSIFVPRHWWHHVTSMDSFNAMVNCWWGKQTQGLEDPFNTFLLALLAVKDLPAPERDYWRAVFEHYVFNTDPEALAHIPKALQGALGAMSGEVRATLERRLKSTLVSG